jgi:hypothetical protein
MWADSIFIASIRRWRRITARCKHRGPSGCLPIPHSTSLSHLNTARPNEGVDVVSVGNHDLGRALPEDQTVVAAGGWSGTHRRDPQSDLGLPLPRPPCASVSDFPRASPGRRDPPPTTPAQRGIRRGVDNRVDVRRRRDHRSVRRGRRCNALAAPVSGTGGAQRDAIHCRRRHAQRVRASRRFRSVDRAGSGGAVSSRTRRSPF